MLIQNIYGVKKVEISLFVISKKEPNSKIINRYVMILLLRIFLKLQKR